MMIIPPIHLSQFLFECVSLNQNTVALIRSFEFGFYQFVHLYFIMVWKFVYFFQIAEYITSWVISDAMHLKQNRVFGTNWSWKFNVTHVWGMFVKPPPKVGVVFSVRDGPTPPRFWCVLSIETWVFFQTILNHIVETLVYTAVVYFIGIIVISRSWFQINFKIRGWHVLVIP